MNKNYKKMWEELKHDLIMCTGKMQYDSKTLQIVAAWMKDIEESGLYMKSCKKYKKEREK